MDFKFYFSAFYYPHHFIWGQPTTSSCVTILHLYWIITVKEKREAAHGIKTCGAQLNTVQANNFPPQNVAAEQQKCQNIPTAITVTESLHPRCRTENTYFQHFSTWIISGFFKVKVHFLLQEYVKLMCSFFFFLAYTNILISDVMHILHAKGENKIKKETLNSIISIFIFDC